MDLSKLSDEDLAAIQRGDMSKVSDEGLNKLSQQQANEPPPEPSLRGGAVRGLLDLIRPGFTQGMGHGAEKAATLGNVDVKDNSDDPAGREVGEDLTKAAIAGASGEAVAGLPSVMGRIGAQTALSGATGLAEKPKGEDTLSNRLGNATASAIIGGGMQGAGEGVGALLGKGARISQDIKDVKSGQMANRAADAIDDAAQAITDKQITPRDQQLRELVQGKTYDVNPDRVKPVFPRLGNSMAEGLQEAASPQGLEIAGGRAAEAPMRAEISGSRALRLKRAADAAARWGKSQPFNSEAQASVPEAESLANILRGQINADPDAAELNQGMEKAYDLRNALTSREGTTPIETLLAKPGTSRGSIVDLADQAGGTKLRKLGSDISTAKKLLLDPEHFAHPLTALSEGYHTALRGGVEAANQLNKLKNLAPDSTKESLINALIQSRQGGQ